MIDYGLQMYSNNKVGHMFCEFSKNSWFRYVTCHMCCCAVLSF